MTINGISGTDYTNIINQTATSGLESTLGTIDSSKATDDEMLKACKEFEQYMIEQVYKAMEKTVIKADEEENEYENYFGDMKVQQYAKSVVDQGGIGLAQQLYEAMKRNSGPTSLIETTTE
ncbi:MAG: rod-binding protein [Lachnospiraceae bacterium]|nr:rod-binding protein [Lachnospiraceae bacterium]MBR3598589.1 rod-binding protein [Lachnospiraceae bacterium]